MADALGTWRIQFNPAVEPRTFKQAAPGKMDMSLAPVQDTPHAKMAFSPVQEKFGMDKERPCPINVIDAIT